MSGWAQREAERKEDEANEMDELITENRELTAERDKLRAELAAVKNLLARIHRDGGHHTEAVGFAQSVADAGDKVSEWLLAEADRIAKEAAK